MPSPGWNPSVGDRRCGPELSGPPGPSPAAASMAAASLRGVAADHPQVVEHYRAGHAAQQVHHDRPGASDTEDLRQAFVHYRALFNELVHAP
jgi:hypothetical protein